ncbi:MAG TPA: tetratricopeptide repeat protein [Drouetiella sp.]|jgi:Flp pilus assembly protein TadD
MTGTKKSGSKSAMSFSSVSLVLTGIALATTISPLAATAAGTKPLPIERIGLDNARQLVVQFASEPGAFPSIPNVLDLPGPNHRVVVDFADTTIDRAKIPTTEEMTTAMGKILPVINGIRYTILPNAAKPTARVVLELPEDLKVTPRVVKVEENSVTINLGEEVKNLVVPKKPTGKNGNRSNITPDSTSSAASENVLSAVSTGGAPIPSAAPVSHRSGAARAAAAPVAQSAPIPLEDDAAPVAAGAASLAQVTPAAPVAPAVPAQAVASTVTTTQFAAAPAVAAGQPVVSADGETVALKGEQKIDATTVPLGATKSSTSASGWDWNSPVENELVSKVAETKSMGDGAAASPSAPALAVKEDPEEAFVKKIAAKEMGAPTTPVAAVREVETPSVTPVAQLRDVEAAPAAAPQAAPVAVAETTPAVVADTAPATVARAATAGLAETTPISAAETAPVAGSETTPVTIAETTPVAATVPQAVASEARPVETVAQSVDTSVKTEQIETRPLELPEAVSKPAPKTASPASADDAAPATTAGEAAQTEQASGPALSLKLYNSAVRNHLSGKLTEAINDYKGALAANPTLAEAHSNLGLIYNQQHNYAGALGEFHKALAINPKDAITYNGIGAALRAEKDLPGAIKNWQTAVDLDPKLATAHYNLGTAFEIQKDYDRALEAYKDAVTNDYRLGEAYYRMGLILQQKHQLDDAVSQYNQALKISSTAEYSADAKQRLAALKTQKK